MQYKKPRFSLILLLMICFGTSEINAQKGDLEAHLILSPLGTAVKGNKFKSSGDDFMTIKNHEQNIYEIGAGIRYYHKKNFGYEFRTSLRNYQFSYALDSPMLEYPLPTPLYTSVIDIDLNFFGLEFGMFYKYRAFTAKLDIEFNHPYRIEGIGPKRLPYDEDSPRILTNLHRGHVGIAEIFVVEKLSVTDEMYGYVIPKLTIEYSISEHFDLYSSCKFKLNSKHDFHTFSAIYADVINDTYETQTIKVYDNFLSFHVGLRYNLKLLKRN